MKKLGNWLAILIYLALGAAAGILIVRGMEKMLPEDAPLSLELLAFGLLLLGFYAAMVVQIAVHEGGHYVFGRLTGYRFVSYRIFSLMWLKDASGLRFCRYTLAGTGGQCLMEPPGTPEGDFPVTLYNLGGSLMNLICAAVCFALGAALRSVPAARALLWVTALIGLGYAVVNGLPLSLNMVNNDGRNAIDLRRDAAARRAFWIQMKLSALTSRGTRLRDMPAEWFELPDRQGMDNALTAGLAVFAANRLMDERRFEDADALMARLLAEPGATPGVYKALMVCDRLYCELVGPNRPEAVDALLDKAQRKAMKALRGQPAVLRTEYALALLHDRDAEKAAGIMKRFDALAKRYPYPLDIEAERELLARAEEASHRQ